MSELRQPKRLHKFRSLSHARAPEQEKEVNRRLGAKAVKGSGCGDEKGDGRKKGICRIETKTTSAKSFSVTREIARKIEDAAVNLGEVPALVVEFNDNGKKVMELAIIPMWALEMFMGAE